MPKLSLLFPPFPRIVLSCLHRIYGLQPTEFKAVWTRMYNIIKAEAPDTVIVWSPNVGYSYP